LKSCSSFGVWSLMNAEEREIFTRATTRKRLEGLREVLDAILCFLLRRAHAQLRADTYAILMQLYYARLPLSFLPI
jgi:hypothetical protein